MIRRRGVCSLRLLLLRLMPLIWFSCAAVFVLSGFSDSELDAHAHEHEKSMVKVEDESIIDSDTRRVAVSQQAEKQYVVRDEVVLHPGVREGVNAAADVNFAFNEVLDSVRNKIDHLWADQGLVEGEEERQRIALPEELQAIRAHTPKVKHLVLKQAAAPPPVPGTDTEEEEEEEEEGAPGAAGQEKGPTGFDLELYNKLYPMAPEDAPGEWGKAVRVHVENMTAAEKEKYNQGEERNAFNQYASDMISVRRRLIEYREPQCFKYKYRDISQLPDATVIIIFHNEAWSVLLRTIHSVLDRSPPELIREIILVDDFSEYDHLKQPLDSYVNMLGKVRILHQEKREGLIRARLKGAAAAKGQVLIFLDSHCECADGWIIPLLDRVAANKSNVVCPTIDQIDDQTLKYMNLSSIHTSVGGFDWGLIFNWHGLSAHEKSLKNFTTDPTRSPTMAGGLFAIDKSYFEHLGTYDPGFDIWGGENLELSFKIWMCGGRLEIIPCSHVGHIFRKHSPYKWGPDKKSVVLTNTRRLAEVWMDDYKKYYIERQYPENLKRDYGDVSARKKLRANLKCKSFDWYIKNIYPVLYVPGDSYAAGEIRNKEKRKTCLDAIVQPPDVSRNKKLNVFPCIADSYPKLEVYMNQYWYLTTRGEIRRDDLCFDTHLKRDDIVMVECHGMGGHQRFEYRESGEIYHPVSGRCVTMSHMGTGVYMDKCKGDDLQLWIWPRKTPDRHDTVRADSGLAAAAEPGDQLNDVNIIKPPALNIDKNAVNSINDNAQRLVL